MQSLKTKKANNKRYEILGEDNPFMGKMDTMEKDM